jgi:hypothetical protein
MNDETLELLSAYLDGALPEAERRALEARLAASADLRRELEDLRSVSKAVKDLPKQPLPPGFIARLQSRRARGEKPRQNWVFLPPAMRPVALALSCGIVALVIWDKVAVEPPEAPIHPQYAAKLETAANAPTSQFDVSRRALGGGGASALDGSSAERSLSVAGAVSEPVRRGDVLPSLQESDDKAAAPALAAKSGLSSGAGRFGSRARAAGRPFEANGGAAGVTAPSEPALTDRTRIAMTEEERSARNEEMFGYIEKEKKKMGIAQVLPRTNSIAAMRGAAGLGGEQAAPAAPAIAAPAPNLLKKTQAEGLAAADAVLGRPTAGPGRLSPDAGLVFSDARSLGSSWVLLGFPGTPPATDFAAGRLVLIKPSATKIVSVTTDAGAVTLVYRSLLPDETSDPAKDRVAPIPLEPKTVLIFDISPR